MSRPEELLENVSDRDSFIAFVQALAEERERAAQIEKDSPKTYIVDGALGWMNGDIPAFLWAALEYFAEAPLKDPPESEASWRVFAEILYCGKIIE